MCPSSKLTRIFFHIISDSLRNGELYAYTDACSHVSINLGLMCKYIRILHYITSLYSRSTYAPLWSSDRGVCCNLLTGLTEGIFDANTLLNYVWVYEKLFSGFYFRQEGFVVHLSGITKIDYYLTVIDIIIYFIHRSLGSNRVQCDCNLRWLPSFLESRDSALLINGNCVNLDGASISSLSEDQLVCGELVILQFLHSLI